MHIEGIPDSIDREKVISFLKDIGIDPRQLVGMTFDMRCIIAEVYALNEKGERYFRNDYQDVAKHRINVTLTGEW
jgi:hypothetical protein